MCNDSFTESGKPCGFTPCEKYILFKSERDHLQGVVQGMTEQAERNAKDLHWHNQRMIEVTKERDALLGKVAGLEGRVQGYQAAIAEMAQERDAAVAAKERAENALRKSFEVVEAWQKYGLEGWVVKELQAACELSRSIIAAAQDAKPRAVEPGGEG